MHQMANCFAPLNMIQLTSFQAEEKTVDDSEQLLADLRKRSTTIAPLRLRRTSISKPITVESLCDWETDKVARLRLEPKQTSDCSSSHF